VAIRPRLKPVAAPVPAEADEDAIAAVINRGGAPAGGAPDPAAPPFPAAPLPVSEPVDPEKKFTLRLSASLLAEIEKDAKGRPDRISVNTWLIGAALQRLGKS